MKKKYLEDLRTQVNLALKERMRAGGFDANAEHMVLLLGGMLQMLDHAIDQCPAEPLPFKKKPKKK